MHKKSIVENFIFQLIYQLLIMLVPFITAPYLARTLGADNIGIYSYNYAISYCFVLFTKLGIDNYGAREIAKIPLNDTKLLSEKFWTLFSVKMMTGLVSLGVYLLYVMCFVKENKAVSLIFALYIISAIIDVNWFYIGIENFKLISLRNMAVKIAVTVLIFVFVKTKNDLNLYTLIMVGGTYFISQFIGWGLIIKNVKFSVSHIKDVIGCIKPLFVLFIPVLALNIYRQMDKIMLGTMCNTVQVGLYEYAEKIYMICISVVSVCADVGMPRVVTLLSSGRKEKVKRLIDMLIDLGICLSFAMSFGVASISKNFISLFYGKEFADCSTLLLLLSPSIIFLGVSVIVRKDFLIPHGYDKVFVQASCIGAVVNFILNFMLIPHFRAQGAVIATITTELFVMVYQFFRIRKQIPIKKYLLHMSWFLLSGSVMMIFLKLIFSRYPASWLAVMIEIAAGILLYSIFAIAFIAKVYRSEAADILAKFTKRK